jgi:predicted dehydrogenase
MSMAVHRRGFLKTVGLGAALAAAPGVVRARNLASKLQVACVGVDGMGFSDLSQVGSHPSVQFVGFCDIDANRFGKADAKFAGVPHYRDYREMFAALGDTFDAVLVDTPDHMHAPVAVAAMQLGKHVYCQKPLAHTVWECRQMRLWAEKTGVATQMGNQIHSHVAYRLGTRLIRDGVIGKVREVHSWIGVTGNQRTRLFAPPATAAVPANVDWSLWIGAAPMRDYAPAYHPFTWRDWQDFGGGALGDFGCHVLDPVFTATGINRVKSVQATNSGINDQVWPTYEKVRYEFAGTEHTAGETLPVTWTDGGIKPAHSLAQMPGDKDLPGGGSLFIGEEGTMVLPHVGMPSLYPVEKFQGFAMPDVGERNHWHDWVDAAMGGEKTTDDFTYAGPLAEAVQLGNVATRLAVATLNPVDGQLSEPQKVLEWDAEAGQFTNAPEASELLTKEYRDGFAVTACG